MGYPKIAFNLWWMATSPSNPSTIALRKALAQIRKNNKLHQSELARLLGKPQSYVSKYEIGERRLDFIEVIDICHALNFNPHILLDEILEIKIHKINTNSIIDNQLKE